MARRNELSFASEAGSTTACPPTETAATAHKQLSNIMFRSSILARIRIFNCVGPHMAMRRSVENGVPTPRYRISELLPQATRPGRWNALRAVLFADPVKRLIFKG